MENYEYVKQHNQQNHASGFTLEMNSFCDMLPDEYRTKFGLKLSLRDSLVISSNLMTSVPNNATMHNETIIHHNDTLKSGRSLERTRLPDSFNWADGGFVSPIKDQGSCGACWAFVSTGVLEAHIRIQKNVQATYSEQNLIDCSKSYGNEGCDGGLMSQAFKYVADNSGINSDKIYGYTGSMGGKCKYLKSSPAAQVNKYIELPTNERILQETVAKVGPVSIGIDGNHKSFLLYKRGIYFEPNCSATNLNHAVIVVGYGSENGNDYWIIKNSWGQKWGESGFGRMARNRKNHCGIASLAGYPLL